MAGNSLNARLLTPFGEPFHIDDFRITEALSTPFEIELTLGLTTPGLALNWPEIIGATFRLELVLPEQDPQCFSGVVTRFLADSKINRYCATLSPQFALLSRNSRSRIFHSQSVKQIAELILREHGVPAVFKTSAHPERNYCVQYQESDFAFLSRLFEEEGFSYFFVHSASGHEIHIVDAPGSNPSKGAIAFDPAVGGTRQAARVFEWARVQEFRAGSASVLDSHFEQPRRNFAETSLAPTEVTAGANLHRLRQPANEKLERKEWPGLGGVKFDSVNRGGQNNSSDIGVLLAAETRRLAKIRLDEHLSEAIHFLGASDHAALVAGAVFELTNAGDSNGSYLVVRAQHTAQFPPNSAGANKSLRYENTFVAIPAARPFHPARVTPRPRIDGVHPAIVVSGFADDQTQWTELVRADRFGRVKVRFPWDDVECSGWVRVSQAWANQTSGFFHLPLIGDEVLVAFVDGSPDWPIIVGSVHNPERPTPYTMPDEISHSGIKSQQEYFIQGLKTLSLQANDYMVDRIGKGVTVKIGFPDNQDRPITTAIDADIAESQNATPPRAIDRVGVQRIPRNGSGASARNSQNQDDSRGSGAGGDDGRPEPDGPFYDQNVNGWMREHITGWKQESTGTIRQENVGGDHLLVVDAQGHETTIGDSTLTVDSGTSATVAGYVSELVFGDEVRTLTGYVLEHYQSYTTTTIKNDFVRSIKGNETLAVTGDATLNVDGNLTLSVGGKRSYTVGGNMTINGKKDYVVNSASVPNSDLSGSVTKTDIYGDGWAHKEGDDQKMYQKSNTVMCYVLQNKQNLGPKISLVGASVYAEVVTGVQCGALFGLKSKGITGFDLCFNNLTNIHAETALVTSAVIQKEVAPAALASHAVVNEVQGLNRKDTLAWIC